MDDRGKPRGLKGEEIPLFARIVSLADVFDALSCKRAYKPAWEEKDVLAEINKLSGSKFDPELVEIFMGIMSTIRQVQKQYFSVNLYSSTLEGDPGHRVIRRLDTCPVLFEAG